jgi:parallel beta-helix repeat protein
MRLQILSAIAAAALSLVRPDASSFVVTNTDDSGTGSLRQAIVDANANCTSPFTMCSVSFAIPGPLPEEGWFTIAPRSPLPEVTAMWLEIDAETEKSITHRTIAAGPDIFLRGETAGPTDGLRFAGFRMAVRGLAIGGFEGSGIFTLAPRRNDMPSTIHGTIERNYLGVDPSGKVAVQNRQRGIMTESFGGTIEGNVISGNGRSGIFMTLMDGVTIRNNRIGVAAASDDAIGNNASGIYAGGHFYGYELENVIVDNVIANSRDWAVARGALTRIGVLRNIMVHNGGGAVDIGLDGPTRNPRPTNGPDILAAPLITSARYEASSGDTIVEGVAAASTPTTGPSDPRESSVFVYANRSADRGGFFEAEEYLGTAPVSFDGHFTLRVHGDFRGALVDAIVAMHVTILDIGIPKIWNSSEFGDAVPVT